MLQKKPLDSSDLDILPAVFFDLFTLADQEKDSATELESEIAVHSSISLSSDEQWGRSLHQPWVFRDIAY